MATIPNPVGNSSFLTHGVFFSPKPPLAPGVSEYANLNLTSILRDIADDLFSLGNFTNPDTSAMPPSATDLDSAITLVNELRARVSQCFGALAIIRAAAHALKTTKG